MKSWWQKLEHVVTRFEYYWEWPPYGYICFHNDWGGSCSNFMLLGLSVCKMGKSVRGVGFWFLGYGIEFVYRPFR